MKRENGYWTKERCTAEALKYNTRKEFALKCYGAYFRIRENGWYDELCSHLKMSYKKPNGYWTYERCKKEALKCKTRMELKRTNQVVYNTIHKNGWEKEMFIHVPIQNQKYNKEVCREIALKYNRKTDFISNDDGAYTSARKNGWLNELCSHMVGNNPRGYWTYERCKEIASRYTQRSKFQIENAYAYKISRLNGWINEFFK